MLKKFTKRKTDLFIVAKTDFPTYRKISNFNRVINLSANVLHLQSRDHSRNVCQKLAK